MKLEDIKVGATLYWTDPEGISSTDATVVSINGDKITLEDSQAIIEAHPDELSLHKPIHQEVRIAVVITLSADIKLNQAELKQAAIEIVTGGADLIGPVRPFQFTKVEVQRVREEAAIYGTKPSFPRLTED